VRVFEDMVRFRRSLIASCATVPFALFVLSGFAGAAEPAGDIVRGTVLETMSASDYTYVRIDGGSGEVWAAGPHTDVKVGDTVSFRRGTEMRAFRSNALDRTFQSIQFVDRISVGQGTAAAPIAPAPAHGAPRADAAPPPKHGAAHEGMTPAPDADVDVSGISKAAGGKTVAEIFDERTALAGKEVVVRGKVVKSNPGVMGRNWLHIRDGSKSAGGSNDLTVTTADSAKVSDTVLVRGTVATDQDFGLGYRYDVLLERSKVTVE
jgi:hypothetical protein